MTFSRATESLPSLCAVCRSWGEHAVCTPCIGRYARRVPRCERCALEVPEGVAICGRCLRHPPAFDASRTGMSYAYPWSTLIARFKFHEGLELTQALTAPLHDAVRREKHPRPDLLIPVPLSRERLRERGYNQAWEATRHIARQLGLKCDAQLLLRVKDGPHQLDLPPEERAANVRDAFVVDPLRRANVQGKHIAVIDDVMTTGATCAEVARVLKHAGATRVEAWSLARTPRDD